MLPRAHRLQRKRDFQRVYKSGKTLRTALFRISTAPNKGKSRYGVVVPNKVIKKAVDRNRKKRQIRAVLEGLAEQVVEGYDIVVAAQHAVPEASYEAIQADIVAGLTKIGFLRKQQDHEEE